MNFVGKISTEFGTFDITYAYRGINTLRDNNFQNDITGGMKLTGI